MSYIFYYSDHTYANNRDLNKTYHRDYDKPAVYDELGYKVYYQNGLIHRDNDKPAKIFSNNEMHWFREGKKHRIYGPAFISAAGFAEWWIDGKHCKKRWIYEIRKFWYLIKEKYGRN